VLCSLPNLLCNEPFSLALRTLALGTRSTPLASGTGPSFVDLGGLSKVCEALELCFEIETLNLHQAWEYPVN
jgi:hypothetical protein